MRPFAATKNEPLCEYSILSKDTCTFNLPSVNQMSRTLNDRRVQVLFFLQNKKWVQNESSSAYVDRICL